MKKLIGVTALGLLCLFISPVENIAQSLAGEENPCDAGPNKNFESCRDKNCTEKINVACSFIYAQDIVTIWGRRES
ncbi:hypothetical protein E4S40_15685 [Algoriphagus kandeliae]|uniref:Uncharacterized protein n=1 Tax=Algoriphagus kandeliae TaxID=2562278 RepID=A0A4Y9QRM3_9BACT|nr:hypothetical protein [Algoriphagus kandeliae]TFV93683.1 hypothetical protein E4S40_15685 [Algoriphagus kandeliae]